MSNLWVKDGTTIDWDNDTGVAVVVDQYVQVGFDCVGIALDAIASAETGSVLVKGVARVAKAAVAIVADDRIYITLGAAPAATNVVATGLHFLGFAEADAASGDAYVNVRLAGFTAEGTRHLTNATTPLTLGVADFLSGHLVLIATTSGAQTVNLPAIATVPNGALLTVLNGGSANARTLDPAASETIGVIGSLATTYTAIDAVGDCATFVSNGTAWPRLTATIA